MATSTHRFSANRIGAARNAGAVKRALEMKLPQFQAEALHVARDREVICFATPTGARSIVATKILPAGRLQARAASRRRPPLCFLPLIPDDTDGTVALSRR